MQYVVERIPLEKEPPLDEKCEDQFLVEITASIPAREDLLVPACDVVSILQSFLFFFFLSLFFDYQVVSFLLV